MTAERPEAARIVIADDHPLLREALGHALSREADLKVVGEATDGADALQLCRRLQPDLVLMDVRMPKMDGLEAARAIKEEFPRIIVLMLTAMEHPEYLAKALRAGAAGYVLKYATVEQMLDAIREVLQGNATLNQELATKLLLQLIDDEAKSKQTGGRTSGGPYKKEHSSGPSLQEELTVREVDVLRLMAQGKTNQEISKHLFISVSTVKKHVQNIIRKLGVSDRIQASVRAIELGLRIPGG